MKEIWKDIKDYEGYYQVSNLGDVKSLARMVNANLKYNVKSIQRPEKILKPFRGVKGRYFLVELNKEGIGTKKVLHHLVWEAFGDNNIIGVIDHIDNDRSNNSIDNLQRITQRANVIKDRRGKYLLGVSKRKDIKKFMSKIYADGKSLHLGYFKTELEAHQAYLNKLKELR